MVRFQWFLHVEGVTHSCRRRRCRSQRMKWTNGMRTTNTPAKTIITILSHRPRYYIISLSVPFIRTFIIFVVPPNILIHVKHIDCHPYRSRLDRQPILNVKNILTLWQLFICNFMTFPVPEWSHFRWLFRLRCHSEPNIFPPVSPASQQKKIINK